MFDPRRLRRSFVERYGKEPRLFSAPGRVNLIGEHTDYNEGFVLPIAASLRTYVAAAPRTDDCFRVYSFNLRDEITFRVGEVMAPSKSWANYVYGVAQLLSDQGHELNGADVAISSEIPRGAGLSSSAALEISFGFTLLKLNGLEIDPLALALASQAAEHKFVGTRCGLMDQLTATFAKQGQALLIDCRSLEMHSLPLPTDSETIVVCDSTVKHDLATSAYNDRRRECELGVELLRQRKPGIKALRDLTVDELELLEDLPEPVRRRCRHVVTENDRTLRAAEAIKEGDYSLLGELMKLSHRSLRDDYEVSCEELDLLVNFAERENGVWGARMVGGGFGGCTVNLLKYEALANFTENVSASYQKATGLPPRIFVIKADRGVREH